MAPLVRICLFVVGASIAASAWGARGREPGVDARLGEQVHELTVPGPDVKIVVTSFRPRGDGPFPWLVLSHGTAPSREANRNMTRYRPLNPVREWVDRGYAVLVPVRRGYGPSGGAGAGDDYGGCGKPDFRRAGEGAALDLLTTVVWAKGQPDLDPARWLLVGQSAGGFASIYTASKRPPGLVAVLAFSPGRGGDPDKRPGEPCASRRLADLYRSIAPQINVPVLWFYAENDAYLSPRVQKLWFEHFRAGGGKGELVVVPPFPEARGHGVFPSAKGTPLWTDAVAKFFAAQGISLPFAK